MTIRIAEGTLRTKYGTCREYLYYDGKKETIALVMGDVAGQEAVPCRVHSACVAGHVFNSIECTCREEMEAAQRFIQEAGRGIVIWLDQEGKANGHFALLLSKAFKDQGLSQSAAYEAVGFKSDARDFTGAAEILADLGVVSIVLLTNNPDKTDTLTRHGVRVAGTRKIL